MNGIANEITRKQVLTKRITEASKLFENRVKRDLERLGITITRKLLRSIKAEVKSLAEGWVITVSYMDYGKLLQHLSYHSDAGGSTGDGKIATNRRKYRKIRLAEKKLEKEVFNHVAETYAESSMNMFLHVFQRV